MFFSAISTATQATASKVAGGALMKIGVAAGTTMTTVLVKKVIDRAFPDELKKGHNERKSK